MASVRDRLVAGEELLLLSLTDRYAMAKAILNKDTLALAGAAAIVEADAPRKMAMDDPA